MTRYRKAISPIIATILLVIIAVAAGVLIWVWVHGFATKNPTAQPALQERIKIEAVNVSDRVITVYVRNIGSVEVTITAAYLEDGVTGNTIASNTELSESIDIGEVAVLAEVFQNVVITSGKPYVVKVVTARGTEATYSFIAP